MALTRPEAVTLALFALDGAEQAVETEVIAMKVAELVPGMFAWQKYPEQIDKELVRVALSDARLKKQWVVGAHNRGGWTLTREGQEFARANQHRIEGEGRRQRGRDERQHARERMRLLTS